MKTIAVPAPAPNGDPLVAPMDGWFLHGKFFFSSGGDALMWGGEGVYVQLDADRFVTYSRTPEAFPS